MQGKVCIVTHVATSIGQAGADALAGEGAKVIVNDASFADDSEVKSYAKAHPKLEVTATLDPERLVEEVVARHGRVDVLVSNAWLPAKPAQIEKTKVEDLRHALDVLAIEPFRLARAAIPYMKKQKAGKIVFMTSAGPMKGLPNLSTYCAARGGATALMKALALEVGESNIQVNAIGPNYAENPTYFPKHILGEAFMRKLIEEECPIKRYAKPEELTALVAFLAADESNFVTSQLIPFCGGWAS